MPHVAHPHHGTQQCYFYYRENRIPMILPMTTLSLADSHAIIPIALRIQATPCPCGAERLGRTPCCAGDRSSRTTCCPGDSSAMLLPFHAQDAHDNTYWIPISVQAATHSGSYSISLPVSPTELLTQLGPARICVLLHLWARPIRMCTSRMCMYIVGNSADGIPDPEKQCPSTGHLLMEAVSPERASDSFALGGSTAISHHGIGGS